jgi:hypothetical protein
MRKRNARPFRRLSKRNRRRTLWMLAAAEVAQLGPLLALERRMKRTGGPGIIPFELAGTPEKANRILETWGEEGSAAARKSLILDFPFPATYALLQSIACTAASDRLRDGDRPGLADAGAALAWAQLAAAIFDYVENTALLFVLGGRDGQLPALARRAALIKFALSSGGLGYVLLSIAAV